MFGQTADMRPLMQIARKYKLIVIEAAGQAQGATYQGQRAGSIGDLGCFSFSPDKNLGAFGEAGGIVTNNGELAARIRTLRNHGQSKTHQHEVVGWNGRMDAIQAVVLSVKLNYIDQWNELRRQHAHQYDNLLLTHDGLLTPKVAAYGTHVYHSYVCRLGRRDAILRELNKRGIQARAHYRTPLHLQDVYRTPASEAGSLPVAERCSSDSLSLPLFPELTPSQLLHVVGTLKQVIADLPQPEESRDPSEASPSEERPAPAYKKIAIVS
jgi:dTDP-4-amino-4,6-dideoxygalactose transaminase